MALSAPVHSKTTSKPSLESNAARAAVAASFAFLIWSSEKVGGCAEAVAQAESFEVPLPLVETPLALGDDDNGDEDEWEDDGDGEGRQYTASAKPCLFANASLTGLISIAQTLEAPVCLARAHARRPIAPTPNTRTDWEGARPHRREAWMTTESGSASEAWSKVHVSGKLDDVWLSSGKGGKGDTLMQHMGRVIHLRLQGAINMWINGGAATKLHAFAEIISSYIAKVASTAVNASLDGYTVTDEEILDAVSDCGDNTGGFMT